MDKKPNIGGQAVIEGVMMRNANAVATAVREPSGTITVKNEKIISIAERFPILKKPLKNTTDSAVSIRGMELTC